jgi:lipoprotein NlpD
MCLDTGVLSLIKYFIIGVFVWLLVGCSTSQYAPVQELSYSNGLISSANRVQSVPKSYQVKSGDTMFAIGWRFGWDYKTLAKVNNIPSPYTIYVGQILYFNDTDNSNSMSNSSAKKLIKKPVVSDNAVVNKPASSAPVNNSNTVTEKAYKGPLSVQWNWPLQGRVIKSFSSKGSVFHGIDLSSSLGNSVKAASSGIIVYAGSGIQGYGKLVVIKHNNTFLSAYAYNSRIVVKEGDTVKAGQVIAKVGKGPQLDPRLHFEIRKNGKPVNPLSYLPKL